MGQSENQSSADTVPSADTVQDTSGDSNQRKRSPVEQRVTEISQLLKTMDQTVAEGLATSDKPADPHENQLVQVRLGMATGLFTALRCKHAPTASHCLRVALGCSAWALAMKLSEAESDLIEVAALLHDLGKIGVPDAVLLKPGRLAPDEVALMSQHRDRAMDILSSCCASREVLDNVKYGSAWYDGSVEGFDRQGEGLPLGARMIAITDAFDAMTTDHVYRPARSRERALAELFEYAGTQFDPELVSQFVELHTKNRFPTEEVNQRWLSKLSPHQTPALWQYNTDALPQDLSAIESQLRFGQQLIENMRDGVVYVDSQLRIFHWSSGVERLSGIDRSAAENHIWTPDLLDMRGENGGLLPESECPVAKALQRGSPSLNRLNILKRTGNELTVDLHVLPMTGVDGTTHGATILLHDVSSEMTLEERCQDLQDRVTEDPLTKVANRAEFDRVHAEFVKEHFKSALPCSLIICDIDRFKRINDSFGHQAGDEAIVVCVNVLKHHCRSGDLVARYGGEEFVVLCANCNNATAARRAEQMRIAISEMPQPVLGGKRITASFGVTELQLGDTPETMLRRSDRALLQAKDNGRNSVIQLGTGMGKVEKPRRWWPFGRSVPGGALTERQLVTEVPMRMALQKLRGFAADHDAQIENVGNDRMTLVVQESLTTLVPRLIPLLLELKFTEDRGDTVMAVRGNIVKTKIHVVVRLRRQKDSRFPEVVEHGYQLVQSLQSYLMASIDSPPDDKNVLKKASLAVTPWLRGDKKND